MLVTGAAGQIAYSLLYSIAKGDVFGKDQVRHRPAVLLRNRPVGGTASGANWILYHALVLYKNV